MINNQYDVIVVGGGPNGLACGIEAHRNGLKTLVIEKGAITESIRRYPYQMTFFSTADNIAIGDIPFTINSPKASREEALNYYRKVVEYYQLPLKIYSRVSSVAKEGEKFRLITDDKEEFISNNVVIATGYFDIPRKLNVPGEELPHVKHYYDEPYPYAHRKVVIIGAGNSAVEAALALYRHGVDVSMIVRKDEVKKTAKYWLLPDLLNRIKEGSIKAYYQHETLRIKNGQVIAKNIPEGKEVTILADNVFILTGYLPDSDFMKGMGIKINKETLEPSYNPESFETDVKGLYVAGTVTAGIHTEKVFIENGRLHGKNIVRDILSKN